MKKYPYYIKMADNSPFALAGIWDNWVNKKSGENLYTFSIITTEANSLLARIHNTKKRMPVILKREDEKRWLMGDLEEKEIKKILLPNDDIELEAYTISRLVSLKDADKNKPEVLNKVEYQELKDLEF